MAIPTNPTPGEFWTNDVTGVTYRWDDDRWVVVSTSGTDYVTKPEFEELEEKVEALEEGDIDLSEYATKIYSDAEDDKLATKIEELEITKGSVAKYEVKSITLEIQARPGGVSFDAADASAITSISLSPEDQNGNLFSNISKL